jgi:hypothetical protein
MIPKAGKRDRRSPRS